ncbi:MAG: thiamine pyrophosphate-binding protein [bacterium]|nr:thiamine pyrophosphate-binding protein [bacterium]
MSSTTGGTLLARTLDECGIDIVFTLCGNHLLPIYQGLVDRGIRIVDTRTEASAVFAADAYARITRTPAVAMVTGGPGHTNALTGLATAQAIGSPVLVISGEAEMALRGRGSLQEMDQLACARPLVKTADRIDVADHIARKLNETLTAMMQGRVGAASLTIPVDVLEAPVADAGPGAYMPSPDRGGPGKDTITAVLRLLRQAKRPVVIVGTGAHLDGAENAVSLLLKRCGFPAFTVDMARGLVPDADPYCFGYADPAVHRQASHIAESDCVLILGKNIDFRLHYGGLFAPTATVIHAARSACEFDSAVRRDVQYVGDVAAFAAALAEAADGDWDFEDWRSRIAATRDATLSEYAAMSSEAAAAGDGRFHPAEVAAAIAPLVDSDTTLVFDAGDFVQWNRSMLPAPGPGRWIRLGPMSCCGAGTPFALGAKAARPDDNVLLVTADGGFGYYMADFDTALRHDLPFVAILGHNQSWGLERSLQLGLYGEEYAVASSLLDTPYHEVVRALGGFGQRLESLDDLETVYREAVSSGLPACIEVPISQAPSPLTSSVIERGGTH